MELVFKNIPLSKVGVRTYGAVTVTPHSFLAKCYAFQKNLKKY